MSKLFDFTTFVHSQTGERTLIADMLAGCTPEQAADYQQYIDMLVGDQIEDQSADAKLDAYDDALYQCCLRGHVIFDPACPRQQRARKRHMAKVKATTTTAQT